MDPTQQPQGLGAGAPAPAGNQIPEANYDPNNRKGLSSGGTEAATPEEQAVYERFVSMALSALYDEKMVQKHVEAIKAAESPEAGVGEVASQVAMRVYTDAKKSGQNISGEVLLNAGQEIVEATVEIAEAGGVAEFDDKMMEMAFYIASDKFQKALTAMGDYNAERAQADVDGLNQMAESGELQSQVDQRSQAEGATAPQGAA